MSPICKDILKFAELTALGDHRVGILLASNGMLVRRIRGGGDVRSRTAEAIKKNLAAELQRRGLSLAEFESFEEGRK